MFTLTKEQKIQNIITTLQTAIDLAVQKEEFHSTASMRRIIEDLKLPTIRSFSEHDLSKLQSEVYAITDKGEVMAIFNKLQGIVTE
jgi:excinuclease UvrABC nuclease subunit